MTRRPLAPYLSHLLSLPYPFSLSLSLSLFDYKRQEAARSSITRDTPRRQIDGLCWTSADPPGINELANDANPLVTHSPLPYHPTPLSLSLSPLLSYFLTLLFHFRFSFAFSRGSASRDPRDFAESSSPIRPRESPRHRPNESRKLKRISTERVTCIHQRQAVAERDLLPWQLR